MITTCVTVTQRTGTVTAGCCAWRVAGWSGLCHVDCGTVNDIGDTITHSERWSVYTSSYSM